MNEKKRKIDQFALFLIIDLPINSPFQEIFPHKFVVLFIGLIEELKI